MSGTVGEAAEGCAPEPPMIAAPRRPFARERSRRAACARVPRDMELVIAVDTMVAGVHFPFGTGAAALGHKLLAVNLSDLAAMGAAPWRAAASLALRSENEAWLADLERGLAALAAEHGVELALVEIARGPLVLTLQAYGLVPPGRALTRAGAAAGDDLFVTGTLGDAGLALEAARGRLSLSGPEREHAFARLERPTPRVAAGLALRGLAGAAIDVSDGLAADLGHLLAASGLGATVELGRLPLSPALAATLERERAWHLALSAGDDYELVFTARRAARAAIEAGLAGAATPVTRIGRVEAEPGLRLRRPDGSSLSPPDGYRHFP